MLLLPVMLRNRTRTTTVSNKHSSPTPPSPQQQQQQQQSGMKGNQGRSIPSVFGSPGLLRSLIHQKPYTEMAPSPTSILDVKQFPISPVGSALLAETQQRRSSQPGGDAVGLAILHPPLNTTTTTTSKRVLFGSELKIQLPIFTPMYTGRQEEWAKVEEEKVERRSPVGTYYHNNSPGAPLPQGFLSVCETCGRRLGPERNIYVYRGEKGFCSRGCRQMEMELDGGGEEEGESMADGGRRRTTTRE